MRKIITITFVTMDGVMQAPGGPEEDKDNGFKYGGWQYALGDDETGKIINGYMTEPFELLLGKVTYDIFTGYWPLHPEIEVVAKPFNSTKKYVVSHKPFDLTWNNSTLITGDVVGEIKKLKEMSGPDLVVWGSGNLIQTLLKNGLVDRMRVLIYPVTLGSGKRLFAEGTQPKAFKLVDSKVSPTGVIVATYEPAGEITFGTMGA